jgi:hypothetical protein
VVAAEPVAAGHPGLSAMALLPMVEQMADSPTRTAMPERLTQAVAVAAEVPADPSMVMGAARVVRAWS